MSFNSSVLKSLRKFSNRITVPHGFVKKKEHKTFEDYVKPILPTNHYELNKNIKIFKCPCMKEEMVIENGYAQEKIRRSQRKIFQSIEKRIELFNGINKFPPAPPIPRDQ